jgi:hypothetical protein
MSKSSNPWGSGALNEKIIEAEDAKLPVVATIFKMIREISASVDLIEERCASRSSAQSKY